LEEAVQEPSFYLIDKDGTLALDNSHSYYYQVQCQLGVTEMDNCFFIVWTPDRLHIEEIQADESFFEANVTAASILIQKAILPEIIGCWYTKQRQDLTDDVHISSENCEESSSAASTVNTSSTSNSDDPPCASNPQSTGSDNECITYCYCKGKDDGTRMICCDNDNCASGQWFHYRCVNIKRAPRGQWFCRECRV